MWCHLKPIECHLQQYQFCPIYKYSPHCKQKRQLVSDVMTHSEHANTKTHHLLSLFPEMSHNQVIKQKVTSSAIINNASFNCQVQPTNYKTSTSAQYLHVDWGHIKEVVTNLLRTYGYTIELFNKVTSPVNQRLSQLDTIMMIQGFQIEKWVGCTLS